MPQVEKDSGMSGEMYPYREFVFGLTRVGLLTQWTWTGWSEGCEGEVSLRGTCQTLNSLGDTPDSSFAGAYTFQQVKKGAFAGHVVLTRHLLSDQIDETRDKSHLYQEHHLVLRPDVFAALQNNYRHLVGRWPLQREIPIWSGPRALKREVEIADIGPIAPAAARLRELQGKFRDDSTRIETVLRALFLDEPWVIKGFPESEEDRLDLLELLVLLLPEPIRPQVAFATRVFAIEKRNRRVQFASWAKKGLVFIAWSTGRVIPSDALDSVNPLYAEEVVRLLYEQDLVEKLKEVEQDSKDGPELLTELLDEVAPATGAVELWKPAGAEMLFRAWASPALTRLNVFKFSRLMSEALPTDLFAEYAKDETTFEALAPAIKAEVLGRMARQAVQNADDREQYRSSLLNRLTEGEVIDEFCRLNRATFLTQAKDIAPLIIELFSTEQAAVLHAQESFRSLTGDLIGQLVRDVGLEPALGHVQTAWTRIDSWEERGRPASDSACTQIRRVLLVAIGNAVTSPGDTVTLVSTLCQLAGWEAEEVGVTLDSLEFAGLGNTKSVLGYVIGRTTDSDGAILQKAYEEMGQEVSFLAQVLSLAARHERWAIMDAHALAVLEGLASREAADLVLQPFVQVLDRSEIIQKEPRAVFRTCLRLARLLNGSGAASLVTTAATLVSALGNQVSYPDLKYIFDFHVANRIIAQNLDYRWVPRFLKSAIANGALADIAPLATWLGYPQAGFLVDCIGQDSVLNASEQCAVYFSLQSQLKGMGAKDPALITQVASLAIDALARLALEQIQTSLEEYVATQGEFKLESAKPTYHEIQAFLAVPSRDRVCDYMVVHFDDAGRFCQALRARSVPELASEPQALPWAAHWMVRWLAVNEPLHCQDCYELLTAWLEPLPNVRIRQCIEGIWQDSHKGQSRESLLCALLGTYVDKVVKANVLEETKKSKARLLAYWPFVYLPGIEPEYLRIVNRANEWFPPATGVMLRYLSDPDSAPVPTGKCLRESYQTEILFGGKPFLHYLEGLLGFALKHKRDRFIDADALQWLAGDGGPVVSRGLLDQLLTRKSEAAELSGLGGAGILSLMDLATRRRRADVYHRAFVAYVFLVGEIDAGLQASLRQYLSNPGAEGVHGIIQAVVDDPRMAEREGRWRLQACLALAQSLDFSDSARPVMEHALGLLAQMPVKTGCPFDTLKKLLEHFPSDDSEGAKTANAVRARAYALAHHSDERTEPELQDLQREFTDWIIQHPNEHSLSGFAEYEQDAIAKMQALRRIYESDSAEPFQEKLLPLWSEAIQSMKVRDQQEYRAWINHLKWLLSEPDLSSVAYDALCSLIRYELRRCAGDDSADIRKAMFEILGLKELYLKKARTREKVKEVMQMGRTSKRKGYLAAFEASIQSVWLETGKGRILDNLYRVLRQGLDRDAPDEFKIVQKMISEIGVVANISRGLHGILFDLKDGIEKLRTGLNEGELKALLNALQKLPLNEKESLRSKLQNDLKQEDVNLLRTLVPLLNELLNVLDPQSTPRQTRGQR